LLDKTVYYDFVNAIEHNDQKELEELKTELANPAIKLIDPLASLSGILVGADQCALCLPAPPTLSCKGMGAEMVELYCMAITRDAPFSSYVSDSSIATVLGNTYLNKSDVLQNMPYNNAYTFNAGNIFRGPNNLETVGPYLSQLLLYNIKMGSCYMNQKHYCHPLRGNTPTLVMESGRNKTEMIDMQNGNYISPATFIGQANLQQRYIYNGRSLANAVYSDPVYMLFTNAALILDSLNAPKNPGLPNSAINQSFVIGKGPVSVYCSIAEVGGLALKHAWYWKWQVYRKVRPEVVSLWVDNVKNGTVSNTSYSLSDVLLNNGILTGSYSITNYNDDWTGPQFSSSYTLPQVYRDGSPLHPSYPSGHATIAGACCTIMKMMYNGSTPWNSLTFSDTLVRPDLGMSSYGSNFVVEPTTDGQFAQVYNGNDYANVTVESEINKLATNVAFGRNWAGVHYRSDAVPGMYLGEKVAILYMEDVLSTYVQNNPDGTIPEITFTKFNGSKCTVKPSLCKKLH
jgi:hypothetical protein